MKRFPLLLAVLSQAICFSARANPHIGVESTPANWATEGADGRLTFHLPLRLTGSLPYVPPPSIAQVSANFTITPPWGTAYGDSFLFYANIPNYGPVLTFSCDYSQVPAGSFEVAAVPSQLVNCTADASYTFTVRVDPRVVTVTGASAMEGNAGTGVLPFTVNLDKPLTQPLTFHYKTAGGTAVAGQDYPAAEGNATIPAGATSVVVNVTINGDATVEEDETVGLELSAFSQLATAGTVTPATILTDDHLPGAAPVATMVTEMAGTGTCQAWFSLELPAGRALPYTCRVSTSDGTAAAGSDYLTLPPTNITFAPGETQKWVSITVTASAQEEAREAFDLKVESLDSHGVQQASCTIERLAVTSLSWEAPANLRLAFPAGRGQWYVVEKADAPNGPWSAATGFLPGDGAPVAPVVYTDTPRGFFRVRTAPGLPAPGTAAAGS